MVAFDQVSQFVDDHIVDHEHRSLDEAPVEADVAVRCARTPAVTVIDYACCGELYSELRDVLTQTGNLFIGSRDIPVSQHFTTPVLMRRRHYVSGADWICGITKAGVHGSIEWVAGRTSPTVSVSSSVVKDVNGNTFAGATLTLEQRPQFISPF